LSETGSPSLLDASLNVKRNSGHLWRSRSGSLPKSTVTRSRGLRSAVHADVLIRIKRLRAYLDRLAKCESEQARAEQHKAGCGYCEEAIGHEVMIAHGTPPLGVLGEPSHLPHARSNRTICHAAHQIDFALFRKLESD